MLTTAGRMVSYIRENRLAGYVNNSGKEIEDPNSNDDNEINYERETTDSKSSDDNILD